LAGTYFSATRLAIPLDGLVWQRVKQYLQVFDPIAIRYAGYLWNSLVDIVYRSAVRAGRVRSHAGQHKD
jgi:hypothetical protein